MIKRLVYIFFSIIIGTSICSSLDAKEFTFKNIGKLVRNEIIKFPNGGMFISFKHEGGFETSIGKYGKYQCSGSILYNKESTLENMTFACEFKDQEGDIFIGMGKREKGSDIDRAIGKTNIISGKGFWKEFIGYQCTYSVVYVEELVFSPAKCKK